MRKDTGERCIKDLCKRRLRSFAATLEAAAVRLGNDSIDSPAGGDGTGGATCALGRTKDCPI
jgi:hypothetical protein